MEKIDLINTFVKMFLISFFVYRTYEKITNYTVEKISYIIMMAVSFIISILYIIFNNYMTPLLTILILYMIYGLIINKIVGNKNNYIAYIFACIISYVIYLIAILISGLLLLLLLDQVEYANPVSLITIPLIFYLLFCFIFTRKRIKKGFNFLKNKTSYKLNIFILFFTGIIILIFGMIRRTEINNTAIGVCLIIGTMLIVISLIVWIKTKITKTYKNKMRDRTVEIQKTEIDEKAKIIEELKEENLKFAKSIHKYNKKFSALELAMKNALELETKTEFANEISTILDEYQEASANFAKEVQVNKNKLPLTNVVGIDNMFKYMQEEATKNNINFDLKINEKINSLIDNIISKDKFETLIGDHLKDAIIAVNASDATYKSILVTLGLVDGNYELSVYDTGIEFEIETLLKLGKEQITTHKDEGGSGIGFMTTFETLKECKASLIIEEYNPEITSYTKSVTIRFDGKNKYIICSYRAEKIKEQKSKRRVIIQKLK